MVEDVEITTITNLKDLQKYEKNIELITSHSHNFWFNINGIKSIINSYQNTFVFIINKKMICAFKKRDINILESLIDINPIYSLENNDENVWKKVFNYILEKTNSKSIYFPLVYENSSFFKVFYQSKIFHNFKRLYTSISILQDLTNDNEKKTYSYLHKNNVNQINNMFNVVRYSKVDIVDKLREVELNSWKSVVGQDLVTKKEGLIFYNEMVKCGNAICSIIQSKENNYPIAYRLDYVDDKNLIQLKTSFNENYKNYKPGCYLLLYDLLRMGNIEYIDLYGGPNTLKDAIETARIDRYDFLFGESNSFKELIANRKSWDLKNWNNFRQRKGIRNIYAKFKK